MGPHLSWLNNLRRDFLAIQAAAQLKRQGTIHDLRKSFGTHMANHVPLHELRRLMGHASITTTADYYLDVGDDVAAKVRAAFGNSRRLVVCGGGPNSPRP